MKTMLNNKPKVSVIMSVYNGETFLNDAIESILRQTFSDFEFIIVNDKSTDNTENILREYIKRDERIKIIQNSENIGLTKSLNKAIKQSKGTYIARMDADDVSEPERLEKQIRFMGNNLNIVLCGTLGWIIDDKGEKIKEKNLKTSYADIKKSLLFNNQFIHSSLFIRKDILDKEGFYDESFQKSQDYELILRLASKYQVANLPDRLIEWRMNTNSLSWSNKEQELSAIRARWRAITRYNYPKLIGLFNIIIRIGWLCLPKRIKMRRFKK